MCEKCEVLVKRYYPNLSEQEQIDLLWSATCFPHGGPEELEPQLRKLRKRTDGTLRGAQAFADRSMRKAHDFMKRRYPEYVPPRSGAKGMRDAGC